MKHNQGTFQGFGGLNLYYQSWHPVELTQAVVVVVHGLGGHSGLFDHVVQYLVPQGYEVYAFDLRGHGRSPGQRGHINTWTEFRGDLRAFLQWIREQRSRCPCFLWGHSLGGTIVLDYALRFPDDLQGLIVTAPALGRVCISPCKLLLGRLLSRVFPRFSLRLGLKNDVCSRDPSVCEAFLLDPLRHEYGSARLATEFFATVSWIQTHTSDLKVPLLTLHGGADQVTLPEASRAFFQQVTFPDKEYYEYPEHYHDLYVDLNYQTVFSDFGNWLERHLEGSATCHPLSLCELWVGE
ncbi:MAG: alpha/beta hydrolase [Leptolyngbyaceae cyanobacterium RU_5_1]|nr:alpha/beta hydrolase [Leptolyngbyaceae cyanobacterium RU_5_1]